MSIQVSILFNVECESSYKRHIISIIFVPRVYPIIYLWRGYWSAAVDVREILN